MTPAARLREALQPGRVRHAPGVHDPVTALLARTAGVPVAHLSGAVVSAVALGQPDLGYLTGADMARQAGLVTGPLGGVPLVADADTGYGGVLQVRRTVEQYAAAGVAGLHIEDQVAPKRCGHLSGKAVVDRDEALARVVAAVEAPGDLVVIARTDALGVVGLAEAVARAALFADAGADLVFVEGVSAPRELAAVHEATPGVGKVLNRSEAGGPVQPLPDDLLARVGVRLVLHPVSVLLAAAAAARDAYTRVVREGQVGDLPRLSWPELTDLLGQPEQLAAERELAASPGMLR
jgi:2-methylisocitrate lyase-like PEP mutase family enzyme